VISKQVNQKIPGTPVWSSLRRKTVSVAIFLVEWLTCLNYCSCQPTWNGEVLDVTAAELFGASRHSRLVCCVCWRVMPDVERVKSLKEEGLQGEDLTLWTEWTWPWSMPLFYLIMFKLILYY
jgi:hypothetical protein